MITKVIVHELIKESGNSVTKTNFSSQLQPLNSDVKDLIELLFKSYIKDKIFYAEFDESPEKAFPTFYNAYINSSRKDPDFIEFTRKSVGYLESIIKGKTLAKGGYLVFSEQTINGNDVIGIFLIRDTEGKVLKRSSNTFLIEKIEYLDTTHLAMACKINESKRKNKENNYLSLIKVNQKEISDYFTDWISIKQLESNTEFTKALYNIINALPPPKNPDTGQTYTIDEVRNKVYTLAGSNTQKQININVISEQIYGNSDLISDYATKEQIAIDTEFRYDKTALKAFIQVHINRDGINLTLSRGDLKTKVKISQENPNAVIIESEKFASAIKNEINNE